MSLHLFIMGDKDKDISKIEYDYVFNVSNDCTPQTQVKHARSVWSVWAYSKDKVALKTNSDFFLKEINTLIMLASLDINSRNNILNDQDFKDVYSNDWFKEEEELNISCFDIPKNEECSLDIELGFKVNTFDDVIDFQNRLQEAIYWRN